MNARMSDGLSRAGVVLLHGIFRRSGSMAALARALRLHGAAILNLDYPARRLGLPEIADAIEPSIEAFGRGIAGPVHFVTHSMGGLVARVYLSRYRPATLGRVCMLAPPNQGSELADLHEGSAWYRWAFGPAGAHLTTRHALTLPPPDYPAGIIAGTRSLYPLASRCIAGPNDGRVGLARTKLASSRADGDWMALHAAHPFIMRNPDAIAAAIRFLETGRFTAPGAPVHAGLEEQ